ncbi:MAG TPA: isoprenylcysteine carboxylmethyltransferase family protein [Anaeromyxobacter sp.]|nr:isoprenylcysteine carboxylmethyltransferase family protein [Anaeromyxobacter sp.]
MPGPPKLLLLAIGAMVVLALLLPGPAALPPAFRLLALIPLGAGIALNLLSDRAFRLAGTTVKPFLPSTALVTDGVFRLTRNPMYLGFVLLLVGLWLALSALTPGLVVVLFAVLIDRYFIEPEEEKLSWTFGGAYQAYRDRVRRWI